MVRPPDIAMPLETVPFRAANVRMICCRCFADGLFWLFCFCVVALLGLQFEGYTIGSAIKSVPIAGKDITKFVQGARRPPARSAHVCMRMQGGTRPPLPHPRLIGFAK